MGLALRIAQGLEVFDNQGQLDRPSNMVNASLQNKRKRTNDITNQNNKQIDDP